MPFTSLFPFTATFQKALLILQLSVFLPEVIFPLLPLLVLLIFKPLPSVRCHELPNCSVFWNVSWTFLFLGLILIVFYFKSLTVFYFFVRVSWASCATTLYTHRLALLVGAVLEYKFYFSTFRLFETHSILFHRDVEGICHIWSDLDSLLIFLPLEQWEIHFCCL